MASTGRKKDVRGNEALLHGAELRDEIDQRGGFDGREGDPCRGLVEAGHVLVRAEEPDLPFAVFVGFHALEAFEGVVENAGCRVKTEVLVGGDAGGEPAFGCCPFD